MGGEHNFVVLEADLRRNFYVQFAVPVGSAVIYGEAVSDRYLTSPLSPEQKAVLRRLGWRPPTVRKWPNYFRLWTVLNDAERWAVLDLALQTVERVYGWRHGTRLQVTTHLDW